MPRNNAETTCTTSPEQIGVVKLEGYSGPMCNKHVHSTMTRSSRFHRPIGVINKPTRDRVVDITCIPTTCCGEIFRVHNVEIAHVTLTTPLSGKIFYPQVGLAMVNQCTKFEVSIVHPLRSYEWRCKMQKMGWFGAVRGHLRSWAMHHSIERIRLPIWL